MIRVLKIIFVLFVLIAAAVVGYAYLGDLTPDQTDVSRPVGLDDS